MRIALDAMGGDHGPEKLIAGAILALEETDLELTLVGDESAIRACLEQQNPAAPVAGRMQVLHTTEVIRMDESPVDGIRKKKNSSVMLAFDLVKKGEAVAAVSAGNSGATLAAGIRKLGRIKGISRPGIANAFPSVKQPVILMDVGANVDCRPSHLLQFALMASAFASVYHIESPRVGLLSIGEEAGKGNQLVKDTWELLSESSLNFVGNVEGRDLFQGEVDVIVCDGFVGNISLKVSEGLVEASTQMLREGIMSSTMAKLGYLLVRPVFKKLKKRVDYAEYGGAPLLGLDGTGIICHGKSNAVAIKNAILVAQQVVEIEVNKKIVASLEENTVASQVDS
ncbi:MAG: phosphate acyltransferase PlsX [Desulfocapsa sp.]|nr:MAG: phosphate acyltransferase PlsX [Desulfocapsa sp.]